MPTVAELKRLAKIKGIKKYSTLNKNDLLRALGKSPASRKSASRKSASRKSATRKSATRKSASRKSATRKSASRKSASRKSATRKSASRKSASRKSASGISHISKLYQQYHKLPSQVPANCQKMVYDALASDFLRQVGRNVTLLAAYTYFAGSNKFYDFDSSSQAMEELQNHISGHTRVRRDLVKALKKSGVSVDLD